MAEPLHIAFLSPAWPLGSDPNGIVTYVHWMREALQARGHRVSVFTGQLDPTHRDEGVYLIEPTRYQRLRARLKRRCTGRHSSVFDWGQAIGRSVRAVHRRQPIDIVEAEESFGWAIDIQRCSGVPVAIKLHGPAFLSLVGDELKSAFAAERLKREGEAMAQVGNILAPSARVMAQTLAHYGIRPPISEHVVNPIRLQADAPLWELSRCDPKTILFVGRFDQRKGGDTVLLAFRELLATFPDLKLLFVGPDAGIPGPDGRRLQFDEFKNSLFPEHQRGAIRFTGPLQPAEVARLRPQALLTLIASRWENQSFTTLEAMLQGCPLVCVDTGGQGELIEHGVTGLLAEAENLGDLCAQIATVVGDPERGRTLGANARRYVQETHSLEAVAERSIQLYRRILAQAK